MAAVVVAVAAVVAAAAAAVVVVAAAAVAVAMVGDRPFPGRAPNVGYVPGRDFTGSQPEGRKPSGEAKGSPAIAITQQYRERHNMTYELNCSGEALVLRVFFPPETAPAEWRIEARGKHGGEAVVIDRIAATRELAFQAICGAWPVSSVPASKASYDWEGVTLVLRSVRAL